MGNTRYVVWYDVTMSWMYFMAKITCWYGMLCKVRKKSRIRHTYIICNDLIYRPLESVRKYKPCGQTDRQTDKFAITAAETQVYKLIIRRSP